MNQDLMKLLIAVKAVIYNADRAQHLIPMLDSIPGTKQAVGLVLQAISSKAKIPPEIMPILKAQIFLLLVDVARQVTGDKPDRALMKQTIQELVK